MSEWIDPNIYTPDLDFDVIVCIDDDVLAATYRGDLMFESYMVDGLMVVDYWQPLPEPPK